MKSPIKLTFPYLQNMVAGRLSVPPTGGIAFNPAWTEIRPIRCTPETWARLDVMAHHLSLRCAVNLKPKQLAALLLELVVEELPLP